VNAKSALVRPRLASDLDHYIALWATRLCIKSSAAFKQLNDGVFSDDIRALIGIGHDFEKLERMVVLQELRQRCIELEQKLPKRQLRVNQNIALLGDLMEFEPAQRDILAFVAIANENPYFGELLEAIRTASLKAMVRVISIALGQRESVIKHALRPEGNLIGSRLLKMDFQRNGICGQLTIPQSLHSALFSNANDLESLLTAFIEPSPKPKLSGQPFPHLEEETQLLTTYLNNARKSGTTGVNILIHGLPGTGKSEYVRWIAAQLGKRLFQVKECDEHGRPFSGNDRLSFFLISQRFLRKSDVLILFDEIEDVFPTVERNFDFDDDVRRAVPGKMFINRVLESNQVPAFWVSNAVGHIDKAYLRRFDYSFEMNMPPIEVRRGLLRKYLGRHKIEDATISQLAQREQLSPAQIEKGAKVLRVTAVRKGKEKMLLHVIDNSMELLEQDIEASGLDFHECRYRIGYVNTDIELAPLVAELKQSIKPVGAICLYGAPGTGKTALAHYIAREINVPLVAKRASDILSPFVGETEQNIARIFRQAQQEKGMLLLDEADSFLTERKAARNSWEVTAVNEMLTQMESFKGLFICSTNLMQRLDEASLRRFALKIKFGYLRPEQRWRLFLEHVANVRERDLATLRNMLDQLSNLTPGDFATVRRQVQLLGAKLTGNELIERLRHESRAKRDSGSRPIGFIHAQ
jgi:SpoVK/Ycf46/Vps4 family AAA+-type ATPase